MRAWTIAAVAIIAGFGGIAQASFITNGAFDTDLTGWTYLPWVNNSWGGTRWFDDAGGMGLIWGDGAEGGYLYQDNASHPFATGETFTVSFDLVNEGNGQPDVRVSLLDTTANDTAASLYVFASQFEATRVPFSFNYVVEPSRVGHTWRFDVNPIQWGSYTGVDNVSVTAVPEPSTALLLAGASGLLVRRSRR